MALAKSKDCPRYVVVVPAAHEQGRIWGFQTLVNALEYAGRVGGLVYEPLGMTTVQKVAAEPFDTRPMRITGDLADAVKQSVVGDISKCGIVGCGREAQFIVDAGKANVGEPLRRRCEEHESSSLSSYPGSKEWK